MKRTCLCLVWVLLAAAQGVAQEGVRITLDEPSQGRAIPWPVYGAVVLPDGVAQSADELAVLDRAGRPAPAWVLPVSRWKPGGSLKWLHVRFVAQPGQEYRLAKAPAGRADDLPLVERDGGFEASTGRLSLTLSKENFRVVYDGKPVAQGLTQRILDGAGKPFVGRVESIEVERRTPVEVAFLLRGAYGPSARFAQRIAVFRDVPAVFFDHAFRYMGDMKKDTFEEISVEIGLPRAPEGPVRFLLASEGAKEAVLEPGFRSISMAQELCFHLNDAAPFLREHRPLTKEWAEATADGKAPGPYGPDHYGIYANLPQGEKVLHEGKRCGDGLTYGASGVPTAAVLADFWQGFPKEIEISTSALKFHFWSRRGGTLDFSPEWGQRWYRAVKRLKNRGGQVRDGDPRTLEKRELFLLAFGDEALRSGVSGYASRAPEARVDPAALCAAQPFDLPVVPRGALNADANVRTIEETIDGMFDATLRAVEATGGYGWQEAGFGAHYNYDWEDASKRLLVNNYRWFNHFYYLHRNLWMQYFRSGDRRYGDYLNRHFRHWLDIQVCHGDERDNLSPGSWCKDSLCYWENWQEGWNNTYQVHARGNLYYLARTGDPRMAWQLRQWADLFLADVKGKNIREWAEKYQNHGGADFSAWRVPCTAIGNLMTFYEMYGDARFLDMARELTLAFEDTKSPSGTKFILSGDEYEYTMWSTHDEYYRILHFYEVMKAGGDARIRALVEKLTRYWLAQRMDQYGAYDLVAATAYAHEKNPAAALMIKTFVEDQDTRGAYRDLLKRPFGPDGPQGALHPSNDAKAVFGMYAYLIPAYADIIKDGGEAARLRRFRPFSDFPVWVGRKRPGQPFQMSVLCPGRNRSLKFHDENGNELGGGLVRRDDYTQQAGWSYAMFTVRLPADHPAAQVCATGAPGHVLIGTETCYLFYPGRNLYVRANAGNAVIFLRPGPHAVAIGGEAKFKFTDTAGNALTPKQKNPDGALLFEPADGFLGVSAEMHWTRGAYLDLSRLPVERRFGFAGDRAAAFEPAAAIVRRIGEDQPLPLPPADQLYVPGVSGQAFRVSEGRNLRLDTPLDPAGGCIEFWIMPLWDTETRGGGAVLKHSFLSASCGYVGQFRAGIGSPTDEGSYVLLKPEGETSPLKRGKWYHIALTWRTLDKQEGRLPKGRALLWMTINGEFQRLNSPLPINGKVRPEQPIEFVAEKDVAFLIDEVRLSRKTRYLTEKVPNASYMTYGGFDLAGVRKPPVDGDTLAVYRLDGRLDAEGPKGGAKAPEGR